MLRKLMPILLLILSAIPLPAAGQPSALPQGQTTGTPVRAAAREIALGRDTYRGGVAEARLKPLPERPGGQTYLLSVVFSEQDSGRALPEGDVAVRITSPQGRTALPLRLKPINGVFQAEIRLSMEGKSQLAIGSKLVDGRKRIYRFFFTPAP